MFSFEALRGKAVLAPMAGVGDSAFRAVCARSGAACTVSEMVSAKAIHYGDTSTDALMYISADERPCGIQLFGSEPDIIAEAVRHAERFEPDFIDINMGCPVPKVTGNGDGSALLRDPALAGRVMDAAVRAASVPVSVKLRTGWDSEHIVAPEYVRMARECGVSAVAVHGRTRQGGYSAPIDFDTIAKCAGVGGIFVFGNGGLNSAADCAEMFGRTGCDAVMVARGALGNPLIFREIAGGAPASVPERLALFLEQTRLAVGQKGEFVALRQARKHAGFYLRGMRGSADLRRRGGTVETLAQLEQIVAEALSAEGAF